MAKKKEVKPISVPLAIIFILVAFALMIAFVIYVVAPTGGDGTHSDDLGDQSFAEATKDEPAPQPPAEIKEYMSDANVGDAVLYGSYEQNGNTADGAEPIEWIVLSKGEEGLMLISRYCLDCKPYNQTRESVTWEGSSLRAWLNKDFYNTAFSEKEKKSVLEMTETSSAENSPSVSDKVSLLTSLQAKTFYEYDSWRACSATELAISNGARVQDENCWWWLRGGLLDSADTAKYVHFDGSIKEAEFAVDYNAVALRPVIWVSPDAEQESNESSEASR